MKKIINFLILMSICLLVVGCGNSEQMTNTNKESKEVANKNSEVGVFTKYEGSLYYWKIKGDSRSSTAIMAGYRDIAGKKNELVKRDSDGKETVVYTGEGSKEIVISNNKIYSSYTKDEYENDRVIFSMDLDGKNKKEIGNGFMSDIISNRYIVGNTREYGGDLFIIDTKSDEYSILRKEAVVVDAKDNQVYFQDKSKSKEVTFGVITDKGDAKNLITIDSSYFKYPDYVTVVSVEKIVLKNDTIEIYADYRAGSAGLVQELKIITIDYEGKIISDEFVEDEVEDGLTREEVYVDYSNETHISYKVNGKAKRMIDISDFASEYNFSTSSENTIKVYKGSVINNKVYFIVDYGTHDSSMDIGWRYAYKRTKTLYLEYNMDTDKITSLYEF